MSSTEMEFRKEPRAGRRKRLAKPKALVVFGMAFLALPIMNFLAFSVQNRISLQFPDRAFQSMDPVFLVLLFAPFFAGIGLIRIKKWGWYFFLGYALVLICYNLIVLFLNPVIFNLAAIINAGLGVLAVFYFTRRDISTPYMKMYPRGWRGQRREPLQIPVEIDGVQLMTRDLSRTGLYVEWPECPHDPTDAVGIRFTLEGHFFELDGGVVRVDGTGAGVAFRELNDEQERMLARLK